MWIVVDWQKVDLDTSVAPRFASVLESVWNDEHVWNDAARLSGLGNLQASSEAPLC